MRHESTAVRNGGRIRTGIAVTSEALSHSIQFVALQAEMGASMLQRKYSVYGENVNLVISACEPGNIDIVERARFG